jgi:hypothetical protein
MDLMADRSCGLIENVRSHVCLLFLLLLGSSIVLASSSAGAATEELRLDGFDPSGALISAYNAPGDIVAVRLVPTITCPCWLENVQLLFAGSTATETVVIRIWDDPGGSADPGTELFAGSVDLTGSNVTLQFVDFSAAEGMVTEPFRVGIEFTHTGFPSVACDDDDTIDEANNFFFFESLGNWYESSLFVTGDWIVRATITNDVTPPSVPSLGPWGLLLLCLVLGALGCVASQRAREPASN